MFLIMNINFLIMKSESFGMKVTAKLSFLTCLYIDIQGWKNNKANDI